MGTDSCERVKSTHLTTSFALQILPTTRLPPRRSYYRLTGRATGPSVTCESYLHFTQFAFAAPIAVTTYFQKGDRRFWAKNEGCEIFLVKSVRGSGSGRLAGTLFLGVITAGVGGASSCERSGKLD